MNEEHVPDEALLDVMDIGDQAEKFLKGPLGQVLCAVAKEEAAAAMSELKTVSSYDERQIRDLQGRIWRAESFEVWLKDLVFKGREAYQQFSDRKGDA